MTSPEFELAMVHTEYDAAIKSLVVASKLAARYQGERDAALAAGRAVEEQLDRSNRAITRVLVLLAEYRENGPDGGLVMVETVRAALKGKP